MDSVQKTKHLFLQRYFFKKTGKNKDSEFYYRYKAELKKTSI